MARLVRFTQVGPYRIEPHDLPRDKALCVCACGLSQTMPLCDGSHKGCRSEVEGSLYVYDADRKAVIEVRSEP